MPAGPTGKKTAEWVRQFALALDLPFLLIGAVVGGGVVGYMLDEWLHTTPWLMLFFGLLGFIGGLRGVLQSLAQRGGGQSGGGKP
ncbi:MAG TPA: AtpZ/AtpI family protein [Patescibacteria group bacterium]|nr:AtpZ/AtpI family protein [Patescibacteria group bacterium]